jgi:hypothetical protein
VARRYKEMMLKADFRINLDNEGGDLICELAEISKKKHKKQNELRELKERKEKQKKLMALGNYESSSMVNVYKGDEMIESKGDDSEIMESQGKRLSLFIKENQNLGIKTAIPLDRPRGLYFTENILNGNRQ